MAKTITQLTALAATPDATDELVIADGGVTKKISVSNLVSAALNLSGNKTVFDGVNLVLGTTTGTKLGTASRRSSASGTPRRSSSPPPPVKPPPLPRARPT
jgi:hypothetical protein